MRAKKYKRVLVLANGSMRSTSGKKIIWNQIHSKAKFTHIKSWIGRRKAIKKAKHKRGR